MTRFTRRSRSSYGRWLWVSLILGVGFVSLIGYLVWQEFQRKSVRVTALLNDRELKEWILLEQVEVFCKANSEQAVPVVLELPKGQRLLDLARLIRQHVPASDASTVTEGDSDVTNRSDSYRVDCRREVPTGFFRTQVDFAIVVRYSRDSSETQHFWLQSFWLDASRNIIGE